MGEAKVKAAESAQERVSPLTREELVQQLSDLHYQYQKATNYIQQLQQKLQEADFSYSSFYLSMLFKVMESPAMFSQEFVSKCATEIEDALTSFHDAMVSQSSEQEVKNEAE